MGAGLRSEDVTDDDRLLAGCHEWKCDRLTEIGPLSCSGIGPHREKHETLRRMGRYRPPRTPTELLENIPCRFHPSFATA
jgi:hypothetical protein